MRKFTMISALAVMTLAGAVSVANAANGVRTSAATTNAPGVSNQEVLFRSVNDCRDCWTGGISLRASGVNGAASGNINVPPQVAQNAVFAQLVWVILDDQVPGGGETFNGNPLARIPIGPVTPSPCWPQANAYAFRADVLPFLATGANALTNFPDFGDASIAPSVEGATLIVVYDSGVVDKEIVVLVGNDSNIQFDPIDLALPVASPAGFGAELTMVVSDGQPAPDAVLWNGTYISSPDAFLGLDSGPGIGYWDTEEFGVATGGANTVQLEGGSGAAEDCLNWVATVFCVKKGGCAVPVEQSTWSKVKSLIRAN